MERNAPDEMTSMLAPNWRVCSRMATVSGWDAFEAKTSPTRRSFHVQRNW